MFRVSICFLCFIQNLICCLAYTFYVILIGLERGGIVCLLCGLNVTFDNFIVRVDVNF